MRAWATWTLLGCSIAVFVLDAASGRAFIEWGAKTADIWTGQYYRLLSATFLHADLRHLLFNMYALFLFGRVVEALLGPSRFLLLYLSSGTCGYMASLLSQPAFTAVGASAAIFGLMGYTLHYRLRRLPLRFMRIDTYLLQILGLNLVIGFIMPRIDQLAHLGGLFGGMLMGSVLGLPRYQQRPRPAPGEMAAALIALSLTSALALQPVWAAARLEAVSPTAARWLDNRYGPYFAPLWAQSVSLLWLYADQRDGWQPAEAVLRPEAGRPVRLAVFWRWERGAASLRPVSYAVEWARREPGVTGMVHTDRYAADRPDEDDNLIYARSALVVERGEWQVTVKVDGRQVWQRWINIMPTR
jgi:membrane associated rhomboid family serine protease